MTPEQDPGLIAVARAIAAGEAVDWAALESSSDVSPSFAAVLRDLKTVAQIAEMHRSLPAVSSGQDEDGAVAGAATTDQSEQVPIGSWGALRLLEHVGQGAFGDVYRASDPRLDREVALKLLRRPPLVQTSNST